MLRRRLPVPMEGLGQIALDALSEVKQVAEDDFDKIGERRVGKECRL